MRASRLPGINICVLLFLLLTFVSCATQGGKKAVKRVPPTDNLRKKMKKEEYLAVLRLIRKERENQKKEGLYRNEYISAINGLIYNGKLYYFMKRYEKGALTFRTVLNFFPSDPEEKWLISDNHVRVKEYIDEGSRALMEEGLAEYREGNLGYAIKIWKKIIIFNPNYKEARKAIDTATVQLNNLRSLKEGEKQ